MLDSLNNKPVVAQLCKAPLLGRVKTRMQPFLNERQSVQLHTWLAERTVHNVCGNDRWQCDLWGDQHHAFFQTLIAAKPLNWQQQAEGDLGAKLGQISQFYSGRPSLLVGSDCPFIDADLVTQVFRSLEEGVDMVLVPAHDGGYVGLATVEHYPELFESIAWGSEIVAAQTLDRAAQLNLSVNVLPPLADIDRPEDLALLEALQPGLSFIAKK